MPRGLTATQKAALASRVKGVAYFVEIETPTPIRVWSGVGEITTLGETWTGVGECGIIDGVQSDQTLKSQAISLSLVGLPNAAAVPGIIDGTRAVRYQGKPLRVYFGVTNADTGALIDAPVAIWSGYCDVLGFRRGDTITATLTAEHLSSRLRLANGNRMTTQSHNARLGNSPPSDLFFEPQTRLQGVAQATLG